MLTGVIDRYKEPVPAYKTTTTTPNYDQTWAKKYKDMGDAVNDAAIKGFAKGVKVNLKTGHNTNIGVVSGFASTIKEAFDDLGEINPIGVFWGDSKYEIFYKADELEIVE